MSSSIYCLRQKNMVLIDSVCLVNSSECEPPCRVLSIAIHSQPQVINSLLFNHLEFQTLNDI